VRVLPDSNYSELVRTNTRPGITRFNHFLVDDVSITLSLQTGAVVIVLCGGALGVIAADTIDAAIVRHTGEVRLHRTMWKTVTGALVGVAGGVFVGLTLFDRLTRSPKKP
jgi:hypothetical protein